jgi:hypothetical protein
MTSHFCLALCPQSMYSGSCGLDADHKEEHKCYDAFKRGLLQWCDPGLGYSEDQKGEG